MMEGDKEFLLGDEDYLKAEIDNWMADGNYVLEDIKICLKI